MATFVVEVVETSVAEVVVKRWVEDFARVNGSSIMPFSTGNCNFMKGAELAEGAANPMGPSLLRLLASKLKRVVVAAVVVVVVVAVVVAVAVAVVVRMLANFFWGRFCGIFGDYHLGLSFS